MMTGWTYGRNKGERKEINYQWDRGKKERGRGVKSFILNFNSHFKPLIVTNIVL
jgi:hypothetical protein